MDQGARLCQVALKYAPVEKVHVHQQQSELDWGNERPAWGSEQDMVEARSRFNLARYRATSCERLNLDMHHTLYDVMLLDHLPKDLSAESGSQFLMERSTHFKMGTTCHQRRADQRLGVLGGVAPRFHASLL